MKHSLQPVNVFNLLLSVLSCTGIYTVFPGEAGAAAGSLEFRCEAPASDTVYNWSDACVQPI